MQVGRAEDGHQGTLPDGVVPLEHNRLIVEVLAADVPLVQVKLVKVQEQLGGGHVVPGGVGGQPRGHKVKHICQDIRVDVTVPDQQGSLGSLKHHAGHRGNVVWGLGVQPN
jgi:hypothetical protein